MSAEQPKPLRPWMQPLIDSIIRQLGDGFLVRMSPNQDGDADGFVRNSRYAEPHGHLSIMEDDPPSERRMMMILMGVQGTGGGRHVDFSPDESGVTGLVYYIKEYYRAIDIVRADAVVQWKKQNAERDREVAMREKMEGKMLAEIEQNTEHMTLVARRG